MNKQIYRDIIDLITQASRLAQRIGIKNILQPGLVKEMIISQILGHKLITSKRSADACDPKNSEILYEYLSCKEGGSGQFDAMFKYPPEKRRNSLHRVLRNHKIYYVIFYEANQVKVKEIYELEPMVVADEVNRQLDVSKNDKSHISLSYSWVKINGIKIYSDI